MRFINSSTAGNATIINSSDGLVDHPESQNNNIAFFNNSTAGQARLILTRADELVDFSATTGPNNDGKVTAGSVEGTGNYYLGPTQLRVGGNNLSTTLSGVISDCGTGGNQCFASSLGMPTTGGSLVKVGTGTLTLTGPNTYTGGTNINGGTLAMSGTATLGNTANTLTVSGGSLDLGTTTQTQNGGLTLSDGTIRNGTLSSNGVFSLQAGTVSAVLAGTAHTSRCCVAARARSRHTNVQPRPPRSVGRYWN